jgi:hypothetical protein
MKEENKKAHTNPAAETLSRDSRTIQQRAFIHPSKSIRIRIIIIAAVHRLQSSSSILSGQALHWYLAFSVSLI